MTYCPPHGSVQSYEFTALQGADILAAWDSNLGCGDCFDMPDSATTCITVYDNDASLSGDACNNEWGDDSSWQIADIKVDGELVHNGEKIYAEEIYSVRDQHGNCYWLVEIEVVGSAEGDRDDFYAFVGNVPPADAVLTVVSKQNVSGNWLDYRDLSAGLKWDLDEDDKVTIEAEDMALWGYKVDDVAAASGGEVIRLKKGSGEASVTFGAETGTYDIELAYIDENDGEGTIEVWLNGVLLHTVELDQNNNGNGNDWSSISTVKIEDVDIAQGDEIVLRGTRDAWEFARIDALTFCLDQNEPPVAEDDATVTDENTAFTLDLLANDGDPDGDPIVVSQAGGVAPGTEFTVTSAGGRTATLVVSAAGVLTLDPTIAFNDMRADETDTVTFSYEISDGELTDTASVTVQINGLNDPPVAVDDFYNVSEISTTVLDILTNDSDPEDDDLTFEILTQPIEGQVTINAAGEVVFDTLDDFTTLSDGQTATVSFDYQISDGEFTDTATATITVHGEGDCPITPQLVTGLGALPSGDFLTVGLEAPDITKDGTADFRFSVSLGDLETELYNVVYIIDVSGSTGAIDSFGPGTTVLEAEVAALQNLTADLVASGIPEGALTITVIPFNSRAAPTEPVDGEVFPIETFGDNEVLDASLVDASLTGLASGGETNYIAAIFAATGTILQLEAQRGDANNLVYFLSDGNPFPEAGQSPPQLSALSTTLKSQADVHGIALGELVETEFLDAVDNTGGAVHVFDTAELEEAISEAPMEPDVILGAELTVFAPDGSVADSFQFTGADFDETPLGFELNVESVAGLGVLVGDVNTAELVVEFDENGDQIADETVSLSVDIEGVLPLSFDF